MCVSVCYGCVYMDVDVFVWMSVDVWVCVYECVCLCVYVNVCAHKCICVNCVSVCVCRCTCKSEVAGCPSWGAIYHLIFLRQCFSLACSLPSQSGCCPGSTQGPDSIPSTGVGSAYSGFSAWVQGTELRSSCCQGKHFTDWVTSPAPSLFLPFNGNIQLSMVNYEIQIHQYLFFKKNEISNSKQDRLSSVICKESVLMLRGGHPKFHHIKYQSAFQP